MQFKTPKVAELHTNFACFGFSLFPYFYIVYLDNVLHLCYLCSCSVEISVSKRVNRHKGQAPLMSYLGYRQRQALQFVGQDRHNTVFLFFASVVFICPLLLYTHAVYFITFIWCYLFQSMHNTRT